MPTDSALVSLLLGEAPPASSSATATTAAKLTHLVACGEYAAALADPVAQQLVDESDLSSSAVGERARAFLKANAEGGAESVLAIGAAALCLFTHANWTGAPVAQKLSTSCFLAVSRCDTALSALEADGEPAYALIEAPRLLCAARALLIDLLDELSVAQPMAAPWWAARCATLHQRCLGSTAPSLEKLATRAMRVAIVAIHADDDAAATTATATDAQGAHAVAETASLSQGASVVVHGLEGRPELNGQPGVVGKYDEAKGRYAVQLGGGGAPMLLKAENLLPCDAHGASEGRLGGLGGLGGVYDALMDVAEEKATGAGSTAHTAAAKAWPAEWEARGARFRDVLALAHLEFASLLLQHRRTAGAHASLSEAKRALGISTELSGALGRKTRYQEKATSLLILRVYRLACAPERSTSDCEAEVRLAKSEAEEASVPGCVIEEDDTLLQTPELVDVTDAGSNVTAAASSGAKTKAAAQELPSGALRPLEQQAILLEAEYIQASRPAHESTVEEMEPYVSTALRLPRRWAISTQALRIKARHESRQKRRQHQSLMQLEALVDDVRPPAADEQGSILSRHIGELEGNAAAAAAAQQQEAGQEEARSAEQPDAPTSNAAEIALAARAAQEAPMRGSRLAARLRGFWGVMVSPRWLLGAELARALAALGLLNEAAKLFEQHAMWEECASAMTIIGQAGAAEAMVREQIDKAPTAGLWVHLGDLSKDEQCYHTAWEVSKGRCAQAKLKLGSCCIQRQEWAEARAHLQAALGVKQHYAEAWYCCAVCLLKLEDADGALSEMRRVIAIDPTHHQAWSALGGIFAKKRMKREALLAFREACKLQSHNADLWMHAALAALDLGHFHEAIYASKLSIDFGGAPAPQISSLLSQAVAKDLKDEGDGRRTRLLLDRCRVLLKASTGRAPIHAVHWEARLHLEEKCGDDDGASVREVLAEQLEAYKKYMSWKTDNADLEQVAEVAAQLVEKQLDSGDLELFRAAKVMVDKLLYEASEKLAASPGCEQLRMLMSRIQRHDDD